MSRRISSLGIMGVLALVALFAILPVVGAAPRAADAKTIAMKDFKFDPQTITINVGDTITWQNGDQTVHTATADDGSFNTNDVAAGASSQAITFNNAGTFAFYCKYHGGPGGKGMSGTIVVQAAAATQPTAAAPVQGSTPTGSITVSDQSVKDGAITISKASISQDGWIVVHKAGPDGKLLLTPVIGQVQIKAGDSSNIAIKLTEAVADGATLWPMVHIDEGQKGVYEFPNGPDVPVVANGAPVMQEIKVTTAAAQGTPTGSITVSDQSVKDGAITISKASISQDGWIVVHKAGPDGKLLLTPVIGQVQIKAGDSSNIAIKLTEAVAVGAPLWPMVHIDEGQKGVYEFPNGPDVPVVANGAPVMQEIKVTAGGAPAQLPRTGGEDAPIGLALSALVLLVAGALVTRRMRQA
jgi:LPXTG-motif cell wall-anchored protein